MSIIVRDKDGNRKKAAGDGLPGKSAYQYAVEGGFTGTEAEFSALLGVKSNPNLLDNAYWDTPGSIVNQKSKTEYSSETSPLYSIDRWPIFHGDLLVTSTGLALKTRTDQASSYFYTKLENPEKFLGETLTLSFLVDVPDGLSGGITWGDKDLIVSFLAGFSSGQQQLVSASFVVPDTFDNVGIFFRNNNNAFTVKPRAAKLEPGPVQTLAHHDASGNWVLNDPPPSEQEQLRAEIDFLAAMQGISL